MRRHILRAELALLLAAQENLGSLLCSPVGSFLPTLTICVQAKLYGCRGKGSPVALIHPFGSKVGQHLSWWSWTLLCSVALADRARRSEQAQGTDVLPCGLCPARPSRWSVICSGAMAPGTGNGSLLWDLQPSSASSFGCLGSLRSSFPMHNQLCSWENL